MIGIPCAAGVVFAGLAGVLGGVPVAESDAALRRALIPYFITVPQCGVGADVALAPIIAILRAEVPAGAHDWGDGVRRKRRPGRAEGVQ